MKIGQAIEYIKKNIFLQILFEVVIYISKFLEIVLYTLVL